MWELDWEQHSFLQRLLCALKPSNVVPRDVWPVLQNGTSQRVPELLAVLVDGLAPFCISTIFALACSARGSAVSTNHAGLLAFSVRVGKMGFQLLSAIHILGRLGANHLLGLWVLLPLQREHEEL